MGEFLSAIFRNLLGYDTIIFVAAIATGFFYFQLNNAYKKLYNTMNHKIHVSHFRLSRQQTDSQVSKITIDNVIAMRSDEDMWYSLFANFIAIFPLLGILGTVISLLMLVSNADDITGNFYAALTSTFWGLLFAIIFKVIDARIAPRIEDNTRSVQMFLDRVDTDLDELGNDSDGSEDMYSRREERAESAKKPARPDDKGYTGITMNDDMPKPQEKKADVRASSAKEDRMFGGEPDKDLDFGAGSGFSRAQENSDVIKVRNEDVQVITDENGDRQ